MTAGLLDSMNSWGGWPAVVERSAGQWLKGLVKRADPTLASGLEDGAWGGPNIRLLLAAP